MQNSYKGFAYTIVSEKGGYVLNINNASVILLLHDLTGQFEIDLNWCPQQSSHLSWKARPPFWQCHLQIVDGDDHNIIQMKSGQEGDSGSAKMVPMMVGFFQTQINILSSSNMLMQVSC